MGNRALRKKAGKAMKTAGFSKKFYHGNKKQSLRYFNARYLKQLIYLLSIKPGTIVNDCDGFNHIVKNSTFYWSRRCRDLLVFIIDQFEFQDGRLSCGCPGGPWPKLTREEIEQNTKEGFSDEKVTESKEKGWWTVNSQKMYDALKEGRHICNKNGIKLPEFCGEIVYIS